MTHNLYCPRCRSRWHTDCTDNINTVPVFSNVPRSFAVRLTLFILVCLAIGIIAGLIAQGGAP